MTETPHRLTVRVNLKPTMARPSVGAGQYRWDRIAGAAGLVLLLLAGILWLWPSSPESADPAAELAGAAPSASVEETLDAGVSEKAEAESQVSTAALDSDNTAGQAAVGYEPSGGGEGGQLPELAEVASQEATQSAPGDAGAGDSSPAPAPETVEAAAVPDRVDGGDPFEPGEMDGATLAAVNEPVDTAASRQAEEVEASTADPEPQIQSESPTLATDLPLGDPPVRLIDTRIMSSVVERFLITDAVKSREPVGDSSDIREDRKVKGLVRVVAFSEVAGYAGKTLRYTWIRGDSVVASVPVNVGTNSWRSYTSKFLNRDMRGVWRVELRAKGDEVLAVADFEF